MEMEVDNRLFDRIYLPEGGCLPCEGIGFAFEGKVSVVSLGGLFIRTEKKFTVNTVLPLRMRVGDEVVEAECVVRDADSNGFGVEFVKFRGDSEDVMRNLMDRLRG